MEETKEVLIRPDIMLELEVNVHLALKKTYSSYPRLPLFLKPSYYTEHKELYNKGLQESLVRGFRQRVNNWSRDHYPYLLAKLK